MLPSDPVSSANSSAKSASSEKPAAEKKRKGPSHPISTREEGTEVRTVVRTAVRTEETFTISVPSGLLVIGDPDHINHKWKGASVADGRFAVDFDGPEAMLLSTGARFSHPWEVLPDGLVRVRPASSPEAGAIHDTATKVIASQNYKTTVNMMNLDQTILEAEDVCRKTGVGHLASLDAVCVKLDRVPGRRSAGVRQVTIVSVDGEPVELRIHLR
jgi:hypothetical protein